MIKRDWTTTDQADAADAERDRRWWRAPAFDPYFEAEVMIYPSEEAYREAEHLRGEDPE